MDIRTNRGALDVTTFPGYGDDMERKILCSYSQLMGLPATAQQPKEIVSPRRCQKLLWREGPLAMGMRQLVQFFSFDKVFEDSIKSCF